jgi:hypothetical protein
MNTCDQHPYSVAVTHGDAAYWGDFPVEQSIQRILRYNASTTIKGGPKEISMEWCSFTLLTADCMNPENGFKGLINMLQSLAPDVPLAPVPLLFLAAKFDRKFARVFKGMKPPEVIEYLRASPTEVLTALGLGFRRRTPEESARDLDLLNQQNNPKPVAPAVT